MRKLFYLFMVAMCATMFTACSDDDDKDPLDDDGEGKEGVITMVCEDYHYEIYLGVETFKEGEIVTVDWGDGNVDEFKSFKVYKDWDEDGEDEIHYVLSTDDIEHEYSNKNPHIVTIKGNIKGLDCYYNNLTSLNVSGCTALTDLNCSRNDLISLNVSGCTALTFLDCGYNNLTSLDVSKNTALTYLDCDFNNLTSLDVSKNTKLTLLYCNSNNFSASALNQIFKDLPQGKTWTDKYEGEMQSTIETWGNPGSNTCDKSIAKNKGWITKY